MKVLEYNQMYLTWLGLLSHKLEDPTNDFLKSINTYIMLIGFAGPMLGCTGTYVYVHRDNLLIALRAVLVFCAGAQCAGSHVYLGVNMKTIKKLHLDLQKMVDKREYLFVKSTE